MTTEGRTAARAILGAMGALVTAVLGSACCWLPLMLIALGFSAAGVANFFDQYRPYFLVAAFALLGVAWHYTYPTLIGRGWARLTGRTNPAPAMQARSATNLSPTSAASCCGSGPESCCSPFVEAKPGQPPHRRFTLRQMNQLLLGVTTALVVVFALFPHWLGALLAGGRGSSTSVANLDNHQQIVLKIGGMTEECCATIVETALRSVPGVSGTTVSHEKGQAVVFVAEDREVPREAILQAVREAGYEARVISDPVP